MPQVRSLMTSIPGAALLLAACAPGVPSTPAAAGGPGVARPAPVRVSPVAAERIAFGITPWQDERGELDLRRRFKPLLDRLSQRLGRRVVAVSATSYAELTDLVAAGDVQLALMAPLAYLSALERTPELELLVTALRWNDERSERLPVFYGHVLSLRTPVELDEVRDLEGLRIGFVDRQSCSGYVYPRLAMQALGIEPETFFGKTYFLGSHSAVTDAIVAGSIDAGATSDFNWADAVQKHGYVFKALLKTPAIPNPCVVAHPSLDAALRAEVVATLLEADPALLAGTPVAGFAPSDESLYDELRGLP